jgi:hypothetical protein
VRIEPGDPDLPPAIGHVTPAFRGVWWSGDRTLLERRPRFAIV